MSKKKLVGTVRKDYEPYNRSHTGWLSNVDRKYGVYVKWKPRKQTIKPIINPL